jgi:hypothetical protein
VAAMRTIKPISVDKSGDEIVLAYEDEAGEKYEAKISTVDAATLISILSSLIPQIAADPSARSPRLPGMRFVQLLETGEEVFLRISISEHVFHDYPVPKDTTLAEDLRFLCDRVAARQEAKVTHRPPDSPSGKN